MDFNKQLDDLEDRVEELKASVAAAARENHEQLKQRIDQTNAQMNKEAIAAQADVDQASARAKSQWVQVKADAASKVAKAKHDIDRRGDQFDADVAESDAEAAEDDAAAAIDLAAWAVENSRAAILDAIDARLYANEKAGAVRV